MQANHPTTPLLLKSQPLQHWQRKALVATGAAFAILATYVSTTTHVASANLRADGAITLAASGPCDFQDGTVIAIQADTGEFVTRCHDCISYASTNNIDSTFIRDVDVSRTDTAKWTVKNTGNGKLVFQSDTGSYLARCHDCIGGGALPDAAFVNVLNWRGHPEAQWKCTDLGNDKVALQADNGMYMMRCNKCVPGNVYPESVALKGLDPTQKATAQWTLYDVNGDDEEGEGSGDGGNEESGDTSNDNSGDGNGDQQSGDNSGDGNDNQDSGDNSGDGNGDQESSNNSGDSSGDQESGDNDDPCIFEDGTVVAIQADTGEFVTRCHDCISYASTNNIDSTFIRDVDVSRTDTAKWTVKNTGNGKLVFQSDTGSYLARCHDCIGGGALPDAAFVNVLNWRGHPEAQWKCTNLGNYKVSLQADNGMYMMRCNKCVPGNVYPESVGLKGLDPTQKATAQWTLYDVNGNDDGKGSGDGGEGNSNQDSGDNSGDGNGDQQSGNNSGDGNGDQQSGDNSGNGNGDQESGDNSGDNDDPCIFEDGAVVAIQADTGEFVTRCHDCISYASTNNIDSTFVRDVDVSRTDTAKWTVKNTGNGKLAFQSDTGSYLARCHDCIGGGALPDAAFVNVLNWRGHPEAQWKCTNLGNYKVSLQADNGMYMMRCNKCVPGNVYPESVGLKALDPTQKATAQWTLYDA